MAGEFSYDDLNFSFDSLAYNGIYKCEPCNMFVAYRSLAEHFQLRHKKAENNQSNYDDIDNDRIETAGSVNQRDLIFRHRPKPKRMDSDFDTTDAESMVAEIKNQRNVGAGTTAAPKGSAHDGRTAARGADRYQAKRFAKLQMAREQNERKKLNAGGGGGGGDNSSAAATATAPAQMRRKIFTSSEMFASGRSQSEIRTQKADGIFGAATGHERGNTKKFGQMRRSVSAQRNQVPPENFVHCKFCSNLMHKDYVDDHIARKHQIDAPAADDATDNGPIKCEETIKNAVASDGSSSDASGLNGNPNGQADGDQTNAKLNEDSTEILAESKNEKANASAKKNKTTALDKHKGFRRCQFCEAFMHTDYLAGHLIRKHKTEFIGASGITWLKYTDEQMNKLIKDGRLFCKDGALYVQNA